MVAGLIAMAGVVLTQDWAYYMFRGTSEPMLVGLSLWAVDRHLDGRRGTAFVLGVLALVAPGGTRLRIREVAGHVVHFYDKNHASHSGHVAAVFKSGPNTYVVSIHVASPVSTRRWPIRSCDSCVRIGGGL